MKVAKYIQKSARYDLEYDKALCRVFVSSVEVNGWGRRQFMVSGSLGTMNIVPIESKTHVTYSNTEIATKPYEDLKIELDFDDVANGRRYDGMMCDFYDYVMGIKENPFSYEHDYLVQKVLSEIVGGIRFNGKNID